MRRRLAFLTASASASASASLLLTLLNFPFLSFTFDGTVTVHLNVLNPTKVIKLHINEMTIDDSSISLVDDKDAPVPTGQWNHDEARQFFELPVSTELTQGKIIALIAFFFDWSHSQSQIAF